MNINKVRSYACSIARNLFTQDNSLSWSECMKRAWTLSKTLAAVLNGGLFQVVFTKADGTVRAMTCERLTEKNYSGTGTFRQTPQGNIVVWEYADGSKQVRSFVINRIIGICAV